MVQNEGRIRPRVLVVGKKNGDRVEKREEGEKRR